MIKSLQTYPEIKKTDVPWLRHVPAHWSVQRIKHIFREKDVRIGDQPAVLLSLTRHRGILPQTEASSRMASAEDLSKYKVCHSGDLVMNRMQAWSGMFAVSSYDGVVSPDYSVFVPTVDCEIKYYERLFKTPVFISQFAVRSKGIGSGFNRLYTADFGSIACLIPPKEEQAAIVRFTHYVDTRIQKYISAKQKLVKLLEEEKRTIIHQAVTRGLDSNVVLHPSGQKWIGDIPRHWQLVPNRSILKKRKVLVGSRHGEYPLLSLTKLGVILRDVASGRGKFSADMGTSQEVRPGDLIFCFFDVPETPRTVGLSSHHGMITSAYTVFECEDQVLMRFIQAFYLAMDNRKLLSPLYSGLRNTIPPSVFLSIKTPVPPPAEQGAIVKYISEANAPLDVVIDKARREIDLLREYRTRLVTDIVIGRFDVREAAAKLPEIDAASSPLDEMDDVPQDDETAEQSELEADDAA